MDNVVQTNQPTDDHEIIGRLRNNETEGSIQAEEQSKEKQRKRTQKVSILYTNADSLNNKVSELIAIVETKGHEILCISETLPKNIESREDYVNVELEGFTSYHSNTGRGVSIYVKDRIKSERIHINSEFTDNIWVKIHTKEKTSVLIGCIYRSPNSNETNNEALRHLLQTATTVCSSTKIVVGDFNYKEVDWANGFVHARENHPAAKIYDQINDLFLSQLVTSPTRYREGENANLLDWVLTDNTESVDNLCLKPPLGQRGDHCVITFSIELSQESPNYGDQNNYYRGNYEGMRRELENIQWIHRYESKTAKEAWGDLMNVLQQLIEKYIPKRGKKGRKSQPWISTEVREGIKAKNKAWKEFKKDNSTDKWNEFKRVRNESNRKVHECKCNFELKVANEIKSNPKQFWNYVKSKSKKQTEFPDMISDNGEVISSDADKANCFNDYFSSVYTLENIEQLPCLNNRSNNTSLSSIRITQELVEVELGKLNISKAAGPDNLHAKVLHELRKNISKPLSEIFNKSLAEGKLPPDWKSAILKPLHKKGSKNQVSNYRPVSLTAISCKVMERIIRKEMMMYLEEHKLLSKDQHGFRTGRSCATQLLEIMEIWTRFIDNGMAVDCIYLDFAKAFDKVPHCRLIKKLEAYGFKGELIRWLNDFLTNREQNVIINGISSETKGVTSGIPQGSVLGPMLFVIYINDLPDSIKTYVKIFADDTKIFNVIQTSEDATILQEDIERLVDWSEKWQLPFNMDKSKIIHYGRQNPEHVYRIRNLTIETDTIEKDLGITFDKDLKFSKHIAAIVRKANSRLGIIKRNFSIRNKETVLPLYKSLIRPILEYGSSIWSPILRTDLIEVEKVQKRATKLIWNIAHLPYNERLRHLKLDSLTFRRRRTDMIQVYRIFKKIDNLEITDFFELNTGSTTRGHSLKLKKPRVSGRTRQHVFAMRIINDWNQLKDDTVKSSSINVFKTNLAREWDDHPERYIEL